VPVYSDSDTHIVWAKRRMFRCYNRRGGGGGVAFTTLRAERGNCDTPISVSEVCLVYVLVELYSSFCIELREL
jgi:hypothetical protein